MTGSARGRWRVVWLAAAIATGVMDDAFSGGKGDDINR
jgi:hypothetical protein